MVIGKARYNLDMTAEETDKKDNSITKLFDGYCQESNSDFRVIDSIELLHRYDNDYSSIHCDRVMGLTLYQFINDYSGTETCFVHISDNSKGYENSGHLVSVERFVNEFQLTQFGGYIQNINFPDNRSDTFLFSPIYGVEGFVKNEDFTKVMNFITLAKSLM